MQKSNKLVVIGNMALDKVDPKTVREDDIVWQNPEGTYKAGGGGPYSYFAALASGADATLITSGTSDHPLIQGMMNDSQGVSRGLRIHTLHNDLPRNPDTYITPYPDFEATFDTVGNRTLYSHHKGFAITPEAIKAAGIVLEEGSTFLIAPVMGEANLELVRYLAEKGNVIGTIQGWLRQTDAEGRVIAKEVTDEFREALKLHDVVIFSDEDEDGLKSEDQRLLRELPGIAIRTEGSKGATIYTKDAEGRIEERHYPAFGLSPELQALLKDTSEENKAILERCFTGCGDGTGATLAHHLAMGIPVEQAYRDAAFTIAKKIEGVLKGGKGGIEGTPSVDEIIGSIDSPLGRETYGLYHEEIMAAHGMPKFYGDPERN